MSFRHHFKNIRHDFRAPVPPEHATSWSSRMRWRFRFLFRKYGWKLVMVVVAYYLIRDVTLYIIIPLLITRRVIAG